MADLSDRSRVGIEAIALAVPQRYLALRDLALVRGVEPEKYTVGLGALEMAVADPGEDTVALAATAAGRLIRDTNVDPSDIGMLIVGTETGVDHSKAVASFVQGLLKLPPSMRTFDTQHACYGGTAALMAAADWIASGNAAGRSALVICADVARYGLLTPGEPTQGAAAVAMLVSEDPKLLALDSGVNGVFSTDVHDFWRPLGHREARVDGHYSIECYLDAAWGAYRMWREQATARGLIGRGGAEPSSDELARMVYHVPFCKMARKAHLHLRRCDLEDRMGRQLSVEEAKREVERAAASFDAQVAPSLRLPGLVGNTYTGSLYLGLMSLLHAEARSLQEQRVGMFSYGSGCSSEFFSGTVGPDAARVIARARVDELLRARVRIDVAEYERIMKQRRDDPWEEPAAPGTFRLARVEDDRRIYIGDANAS